MVGDVAHKTAFGDRKNLCGQLLKLRAAAAMAGHLWQMNAVKVCCIHCWPRVETEKKAVSSTNR